jgi:hypothetical protein
MRNAGGGAPSALDAHGHSEKLATNETLVQAAVVFEVADSGVFLLVDAAKHFTITLPAQEQQYRPSSGRV